MPKAIQCGDTDIAAFYERHYKLVYRLCFTQLKNSADAEDCTEDVFVKVLTGGYTFNDEAHEKKWLTVTTINLCKDRLKHWWHRQVGHIDDYDPPDEEAPLIDETLAAVLRLPDKYKDVLYLHYCFKLGILPKNKKQNYARLHYLLKDDLMKMEAIAKETRLLCRNHIDTAQQLLSYKGSLETEMSALLEKRKELYSESRSAKDKDTKSQVKAELSDISKRLSILRKEVKLCEGIVARSDTLKEKFAAIRADEQEQQRKELTKNEHRRRSGRTNRPNELGGL